MTETFTMASGKTGRVTVGASPSIFVEMLFTSRARDFSLRDSGKPESHRKDKNQLPR